MRLDNLYTIQEYLAHKKPPPPKDPTVGPCLWSYGGPRWGGAVSDERGTLVHHEEGSRVVMMECAPYTGEWKVGGGWRLAGATLRLPTEKAALISGALFPYTSNPEPLSQELPSELPLATLISSAALSLSFPKP